ncbi:alpha-2-macroglobulin, partial [Candidatus Magnetobacterium casensis]
MIPGSTYAADPTAGTVEMFSPEGTVKNVRQVTVRFSEQMVPFGQPRLDNPFKVECVQKGAGRWVDGKNWSYDFDNDLPGGVVCKFTLKPELKTLSGRPIEGKRDFSFSTGGPVIVKMRPYEGNEQIDEKQVFVLTLNTEAVEDSITKNVYCAIDGIKERVGVNILKGQERLDYIKIAYGYGDKKSANPKLVALACKRTFPPNTIVKLVWGKDVKNLSGVSNAADQVLAYKSRAEFTATFHCMREKAGSGCIPISNMHLNFSAPVSSDLARGIVLKSSDGKVIKNTLAAESKDGKANKDDYVSYVNFVGPFPENTKYTLELNATFKDDSGRVLSNQGKFPLAVSTEGYPPLAKFASRFGIIELKTGAMLPLTVRNIEQELRLWLKKSGQDIPPQQKPPETNANINGKIHRVVPDDDEEVIKWLNTIASAKREKPALKAAKGVDELRIPKPEGAKAFEVIGIPLKKPGLYIVELESEVLGASLLAKPAPMYVPTAALVTNMAAHFKWGRESSVVWVTSLDDAAPVKDASVVIRDCAGKVKWTG